MVASGSTSEVVVVFSACPKGSSILQRNKMFYWKKSFLIYYVAVLVVICPLHSLYFVLRNMPQIKDNKSVVI